MGDVDLKTIKILVNAILTAIGEPVSIGRLEAEYKDMEGDFIPCKKLGFANTIDFLRSIPENVALVHVEGQTKAVAVVSDSARHIHELIQNQSHDNTKKVYQKINREHEEKILGLLANSKNKTVAMSQLAAQYLQAYGSKLPAPKGKMMSWLGTSNLFAVVTDSKKVKVIEALGHVDLNKYLKMVPKANQYSQSQESVNAQRQSVFQRLGTVNRVKNRTQQAPTINSYWNKTEPSFRASVPKSYSIRSSQDSAASSLNFDETEEQIRANILNIFKENPNNTSVLALCQLYCIRHKSISHERIVECMQRMPECLVIGDRHGKYKLLNTLPAPSTFQSPIPTSVELAPNRISTFRDVSNQENQKYFSNMKDSINPFLPELKVPALPLKALTSLRTPDTIPVQAAPNQFVAFRDAPNQENQMYSLNMKDNINQNHCKPPSKHPLDIRSTIREKPTPDSAFMQKSVDDLCVLMNSNMTVCRNADPATKPKNYLIKPKRRVIETNSSIHPLNGKCGFTALDIIGVLEILWRKPKIPLDQLSSAFQDAFDSLLEPADRVEDLVEWLQTEGFLVMKSNSDIMLNNKCEMKAFKRTSEEWFDATNDSTTWSLYKETGIIAEGSLISGQVISAVESGYNFLPDYTPMDCIYKSVPIEADGEYVHKFKNTYLRARAVKAVSDSGHWRIFLPDTSKYRVCRAEYLFAGEAQPVLKCIPIGRVPASDEKVSLKVVASVDGHVYCCINQEEWITQVRSIKYPELQLKIVHWNNQSFIPVEDLVEFGYEQDLDTFDCSDLANGKHLAARLERGGVSSNAKFVKLTQLVLKLDELCFGMDEIRELLLL